MCNLLQGFIVLSLKSVFASLGHRNVYLKDGCWHSCNTALDEATIVFAYFHLNDHEFYKLKGQARIFQCVMLRLLKENEAKAVGLAEF